MPFISAKGVKHIFKKRNENGEICGEVNALDGVDMEVEQGQFIAIIGHNGSGKSTFARHLNALLNPSDGTLIVDDKNVTDLDAIWDIRKSAGMIFQNPDNQIVAGVVEEDVAFGLENIGIPTEEIQNRVENSLKTVKLSDYRYHSPNKLSGGQKQRVAIAGVVSMKPKCIIMDESTAMLDPDGRKEVLKTAHELNKKEGITVILITHYMEETIDADHIFVMDKGKVVMNGTPFEIFDRVDELKSYGLAIPEMVQLVHRLKNAGLPICDGVAEADSLAAELIRIKKSGNDISITEEEAADNARPDTETGEIEISLKDVTYIYGKGSPSEIVALKNINLDIRKGEYIGIIGHTGSGKSTMIQLFDGLEKPTSGTVFYKGSDIHSKGFSLRELRGKVGLIFQYAEYQLFETTVLKDVAFGPKNIGYSEEEAIEAAKKALKKVGLYENCWDSSPYDLSGGEKRRVAIAGVIAMNPEVLVLDEPTAGLDPAGRNYLFKLIDKLRKDLGITIVIVSHSMEDMAAHASRILVMEHGDIILDGSPKQIFTDRQVLLDARLDVPEVTYLVQTLKNAGLSVDASAITVDEAYSTIIGAFK